MFVPLARNSECEMEATDRVDERDADFSGRIMAWVGRIPLVVGLTYWQDRSWPRISHNVPLLPTIHRL